MVSNHYRLYFATFGQIWLNRNGNTSCAVRDSASGCSSLGASPKQKKNKFSFSCAYSPLPLESTSHSFVFIRSAPKQRGCSSVRLLLQRALVGAAVLFPFPVVGRAARPCSLRCSPAWQPPMSLGVAAHPSAPFPNTRSSGCCAVPFCGRTA
jgi:hypothetical protein